MDKKEKNSIHKNKNTPLKKVFIVGGTLLSVLILAVIVFVGSYNYIMAGNYSTYEKALKPYVDKINSINDSTSTLISNNSIDTEKAKTALQKDSDNLINIRDKISALIPTEKYKNSQNNLIQGLTANIAAYDELIKIMNNDASLDITASSNNFNSFISNTKSHYKEVNVGKTKIELSNNSLKFLTNASNYVTTLLSQKKASDTLNTQYNDYSNRISKILSAFSAIRTDYKNKIANVRQGTGSFDDITILIEQNKSTLDGIKVDFSNISIPAKSGTKNPVTVYNYLNKLFINYDSYLDSISSAVQNENSLTTSTSTVPSSDTLAQLYQYSDDKYSAATDDLNNVVQAFNKFKISN